MVECQPSKLATADTNNDKLNTSDSAIADDSSTVSSSPTEPPQDDDLRHLIDAWPHLPLAIRNAITAMVGMIAPDQNSNEGGSDE